MNWLDAQKYCAGLGLPGGGWRLPTKEELLALCEAKKSDRAVAAYPGMGEGWYWSSSPYVGDTGVAWVVAFNLGGSYSDVTSVSYAVRCVH
jgi:formylglycine-generating enzyme required for sulfatase activity